MKGRLGGLLNTVLIAACIALVVLPLPWGVWAAYRYYGWPDFLWAAVPALVFGLGAFVLASFVGNAIEAVIPAWVVASIVIIAVPKFGELYRKSHEGTALGLLQAKREHGPPNFGPPMPVFIKPYHEKTASTVRSDAPGDTGGWRVAVSTPQVYVDCTHTDSKGRDWSGF